MNPRIKVAAWLVLTLSIPAAVTADDNDKGRDKWVSLFDGKTLSGWEYLEMAGKGTSHWEVKDGVLVGAGKQSMLFSPHGHYKNFRFKAELKINDHGNSGMYIRAPKEATFSKGYEVQVNSTHGDPIKTGSIYTYVHRFDQLVPPDTYFTQEVEAVDKDFRGKILPHIKVWVNGKLLYEFIDHTGFARQGHFAFQQHDPGSTVSIRKVEVMELPGSN